VRRQGEWLHAVSFTPSARTAAAPARTALLEVSSVLARVVIQPRTTAELH
jgi:hypothetical protein